MPLKILVADDEKIIVRIVGDCLRLDGHEIVEAFDGKDAMEKIRSEKPDLAILDWMMPYMDGIEVLKAVRLDPETEHLPVIILSAKARDADIFEGYHYGADMYLVKPFNTDELRTYVKRCHKTATR